MPELHRLQNSVMLQGMVAVRVTVMVVTAATLVMAVAVVVEVPPLTLVLWAAAVAEETVLLDLREVILKVAGVEVIQEVQAVKAPIVAMNHILRVLMPKTERLFMPVAKQAAAD